MRYDHHICCSSSLGVDIPSFDLKLVVANAVIAKVFERQKEVLFLSFHASSYYSGFCCYEIFRIMFYRFWFVLQNVVSGRKSKNNPRKVVLTWRNVTCLKMYFE